MYEYESEFPTFYFNHYALCIIHRALSSFIFYYCNYGNDNANDNENKYIQRIEDLNIFVKLDCYRI